MSMSGSRTPRGWTPVDDEEIAVLQRDLADQRRLVSQWQDRYFRLERAKMKRLIETIPAAGDLIEDLAHDVCGRMKDRPDGPSCLSEVPAEAIPRDRWCRPCRARDLMTRVLKEDA